MGLSWHINDVIRQYKHDILVNITSLDIFITLHNRSILSDQELRKIKNQGPKSFISILRRKNDLEFYGFCEVLEGSLMQSIKELGTTLRQEAKQNEPANEESKIVAASSTFSGLIGSTASKIGQLASGRKSKAKKKKNTPQGIERKSKNSLPHQEIASSKAKLQESSLDEEIKFSQGNHSVDESSIGQEFLHGNKTDESFYSRKKAPAKEARIKLSFDTKVQSSRDILVDNKSVKDGKFHQAKLQESSTDEEEFKSIIKKSPSSKILTSKSEPGVKEARLKLFYGDGRGSSEGNQIDDESIHEEEFYQDLENVDPRISATDDTEDEEDTVDSENSSYDIYKDAATSDTKLPSEKASETFNEQKQNRIYIYALQSRDCLQNFAAVTSYLRSKEILTPSQQSAIFAKPNDHESMKTLLETLPQHDDKVLNELCNALQYCGISIESILKGEEPLAEQEDKTQDENIKASKSAEEKEYKEAYVKARRCGSCRNDFIRIMITGPQNVGKSCLIQAFIRQGLILAVGATTAAVITKELVKLVTYNMDDKSVDDFKAVLARKVITAIETVKRQIREEESYTDSSSNDIESSTPSPLIRLDSTAYASNLVETSPQAMPADEDMIPLDFLENYFRGSSESDQASVIDHCHYGKLWDFAGHSIYHITHQPFLSHNCIYLLVLDMSQDMNNHVVNREGNNTEMTYLEALQEWLASIIGSSKSIARTKAEIDGVLEDIAWPMVILVGTHADKLGDEKACQERFEIFKNTILREFPSYADHIYGSGIIFNCNDKDNSEETRLQRQKNCGQLHNILRDFVNHQPFIDRFSQIPLKWYIMAAILHTFPDRFNEEAAKFHTKLNQSVSRIMTAEEIELLAKEYKLCDGIEDIHQMLLYLHDLGEIVYCQKEPVKGKVVTQVEWLLNVFRSIIQLDKPDSKGLAINAEYEVARNTGIMSQHYINDKFDKLGVEEKERKFLLDLMESYDIICKVSKEDDGCPDQYFVPYLFRSNSQEFDCQGFKVSGWLYVGFKPSQMPYIPDGILFCLLVSCYKEWKKSEIEPRYKCAKYRLKEDCYDIVVKKESSYIGIQYRYRMVPNKPQLQLQIEAKVKKSINEKKPYEFLRNKLSSLIKERMPRCEKSDCSYFIKCPSCNLFNPASNPIDGSSDVIFCDCSDVYECGSIHKWVMSSVEDTDDNGRNDAVLRQIDDIEGQKVDIYIVSPDSPASSYINIISKKVGPDWKNLARELDFTNTNIKKISQDNSNDTDQQCVDMLDSHCKLMGETFTKLALVEALFACGLRSVAETILNRDK